jgi:putrescine transport system substrate-binding protein
VNVRLPLVPAAFCTAALILTACSKREAVPDGPASEEKKLNFYTWNDYMSPQVIAGFEKETGIAVTVSYFGSGEELDAKLASGRAGYDVVVTAGAFLERQARAGYYRKLDTALLPNLSKVNQELLGRLARHDPGNAHAVPYMWGTTGISYNVERVKAVMPDAPLDSWRLAFDPEVVRRFEKCGVATIDSASEMYAMMLTYLGRDTNSQDPADIGAATEALVQVRPYIRYADTQRIIGDLASGEICLAVVYNGDSLQARDRAHENQTGETIQYLIPEEGTIVWIDSFALPKDGPHPRNAHAFLDYMMRPQVAAANSNAIRFANGMDGVEPFLEAGLASDPSVYPPAEVRAKLVPDLADGEETTRLMTRGWTRFMTGR